MTFPFSGSRPSGGHNIAPCSRLAVFAALFLFIAAFMSGCGGGGGSGSSLTTPVPATVAGYFGNISSPLSLPCCNLTLQDGAMAVTPDGTAYLVLEDGTLFAGKLTFTTTAATGSLMQVSGSGVAYSPSSYDGVPVTTKWSPPISGAQLAGTMSGTTLMATLSIPGVGSYDVSAVYHPASRTQTALSGLTGNYSQSTWSGRGSAHLTMDGNGVISGSDGNCQYTGTATLPSAGYDVFSVTLTCTPSSGSPYTLTGLSARGTDSGAANGTGMLALMLADPVSGRNLYLRLAKQ